MKRKTIKDTIFNKTYDYDYANVKFGDLPKDLQNDDIICIIYDEESEGETRLSILRERLENDEEYNKRCADIERSKQINLKFKYDSYLKLKEELKGEGFEV